MDGHPALFLINVEVEELFPGKTGLKPVCNVHTPSHTWKTLKPKPKVLNLKPKGETWRPHLFEHDPQPRTVVSSVHSHIHFSLTTGLPFVTHISYKIPVKSFRAPQFFQDFIENYPVLFLIAL